VPRVRLSSDPRIMWVAYLLVGSVFVTAWAWGGLGWHTRGMILAGYGVVILLVLLLPALRIRARLKSGVSAQGTVVGAEKSTSNTDSGPDTDYHPKVRFTTPDGRTVVFTSAFGSDSEPELGHPVPVRYDPDNPQQAEWDTAWVWGLPAALGLLGGLGLLVAGVVVYLQE
jgi:Protein of unknown function (DUF3592)